MTLFVLIYVCFMQRIMCFLQAEVQLSRKGKYKSGEQLEKAAEQLMGMFRVCASDKYVRSFYPIASCRSHRLEF